MSFESPSVIDDDNYSAAVYQLNIHFGSPVQYTSSVVVNIGQLQTDLQAQYQHGRDALTELNQRFHLFVDRIQLLQSQNLKYRTAIDDIRREFSGISSSSDVQWEENYFSLKTNLSTVHHAIVDYQWDFELYQLQIGIYQQLIEIEQQPKNKRISMLEEELKQSAAVLNSLRISYEELQQTVENLHVESENLFQQYLTLTHDWCHAKKQRQKWDLNMDALKSYIVFYTNLRSYSMR
jgi:chromosome segregation ATPase